MTRRRETTWISFWRGAELVGDVIACDLHGNGRRNKIWFGEVAGAEREFYNLAEVKAFATSAGLTMRKEQTAKPTD